MESELNGNGKPTPLLQDLQNNEETPNVVTCPLCQVDYAPGTEFCGDCGKWLG